MRYKPRWVGGGGGNYISKALLRMGFWGTLEAFNGWVYFRNVKDLHLVHMVTNVLPQYHLLLSNSPFSLALHTHTPGT